MDFLLCRHIKTNGLQCQSPALKGDRHCFFHARLHQRHADFRCTPEERALLLPGQHIELAPLEDCESIQVALSVVINALATGRLETHRATALFYGLQLASANAAKLDNRPNAAKVVQSVVTAADGLELAQPGATGHLTEFTWDDFREEADQEESTL